MWKYYGGGKSCFPYDTWFALTPFQDLKKNFEGAGFKPEVRTLASFQEDYGLEPVDDEDDANDDDDDDESGEDDSEEDESKK
jgi:hypothetical protein